MTEPSENFDIVIVGAGPVGLLLGNFLGAAGLHVAILEARNALIDYPRGVGLDDESLRAFQASGLVDAMLPHTTPHQWLRFVNGHGRVFAAIEPRAEEFGWPRRNAFIQPMFDRILADGLRRFPNVALRFGQTLESFTEHDDGIKITLRGPDAAKIVLNTKYLIGCDGGKSATRKALGIAFEGATAANSWIVVDLADDPVGRPDSYLHADPARPYVSIALPHGIRRFEFMLFPGESENDEVPRDILNSMLQKVVPDPATINLIRARIYTHNSRLAQTFRKGRALLAGDAAHVMPVWQGQGFNSGVRDAMNLGWKLALVVKGICGDGLLDSFEAERREHAAAMIALSDTAGKILSVRNPVKAELRDAFTYAANLFPAIKRYFVEMRFKPMPRYKAGALDYGPRGFSKTSPVGRLFIQPRVTLADGTVLKLDDAVGTGFAVIAWATNPARMMSPASHEIAARLSARLFSVVPMTQLAYEAVRHDGVTVLGDTEALLKTWFGGQPDAVVILRPDRFVAATCAPQEIDARLAGLAAALHLLAPAAASPVANPLPAPNSLAA